LEDYRVCFIFKCLSKESLLSKTLEKLTAMRIIPQAVLRSVSLTKHCFLLDSKESSFHLMIRLNEAFVAGKPQFSSRHQLSQDK
jgi:hypothetical protein